MSPSPNNNGPDKINEDNRPDKDLWRYAGFATQLFVALGISVFIGLKADEWLFVSFPVLVWVLPLMVIVFTIYKLIKDTRKKK